MLMLVVLGGVLTTDCGQKSGLGFRRARARDHQPVAPDRAGLRRAISRYSYIYP